MSKKPRKGKRREEDDDGSSQDFTAKMKKERIMNGTLVQTIWREEFLEFGEGLERLMVDSLSFPTSGYIAQAVFGWVFRIRGFYGRNIPSQAVKMTMDWLTLDRFLGSQDNKELLQRARASLRERWLSVGDS